MADVCIVYVYEDKEDIVLPLGEALKNKGLTVGYEDFSFNPDKHLAEFVEQAMSKVRCILLLLSPSFFRNSWLSQEMDALSKHIRTSEAMLLLVWYHMPEEQARQFSGGFAEEIFVSTEVGLKVLTDKILGILSKQGQELHEVAFETVLLDAWGQIVEHEHHIVQQHIEELGNGIFLEMVYIPGGSFFMGASEAEGKQRAHELPRHSVTVESFYMGKFQITQAQWQSMMGTNPSNSKGDNQPVEMISWHDAVEFCQNLSELTGRAYRLPCEAEWEYACRAGTTTAFSFGDSITTEVANYNGTYSYASAPQGIFRQKTTDVGSFPPNRFGLYDMHGNVREWCADPWHANYDHAPSEATLWEEWGNSSLRVLRGGAWDFNCLSCRSAARNWRFPVFGSFNIGMRVVYSPE